MNVAILGASTKPERLANMAQVRLSEAGHRVYPVNPIYPEVMGVKTYKVLSDIHDTIDTLTVYVSPDKLDVQGILNLKPKRVIFNPGSEQPMAIQTLRAHNIEVMEACTLVMLSANSF